MSLDDLISAATQILGDGEKTEDTPAVKLKQVTEENEDKLFLEAISSFEATPKTRRANKSKTNGEKTKDKLASHIHTGDTDSSDDEQNRDYENAKLNECGKDVKRLLASDYPSNSDSYTPRKEQATSWKQKSTPTTSSTSLSTFNDKLVDKNELHVKEAPTLTVTKDVYTDPVFSIRIVKPLISGAMLQERMIGRDAVHLAKLKWYISKLSSDKNWVVAGVIVRKTTGKTSAKGNNYSIWTLSDLHGDLKTVTVFLFKSANKEMWKLSQGTVVGILNPSIFESKGNGKEEATLSVDNAQKVMVIGQSKDLGQCRSTTKSGEKCTAFVNTSRCEFCIYHVKQEYQKCSSGRSELQSSFAGRGLTALRNKVLGKNEVFYGGKSYTAIPAKKNKKQETKDQRRLDILNGKISNDTITSPSLRATNTNKPNKKSAPRLDISYVQKAKDMALLQKLGGRTVDDLLMDKPNPNASSQEFTMSSTVTLEESKNNALSVIAKLKAKQAERNNSQQNDMNSGNTYNKDIQEPPPKPKLMGGFIPKLSGSDTIIDLNAPVSRSQQNRAKMNAIKFIRQTGPIAKANPMNIRGTAKKRPIEELVCSDPKKQKLMENEFLSDRFKKMIAATSSHTDLVEQHDNEQQEKYFNKMEMKERLEEKMMTTYKIECKAVRCLQCKYTSFSAADKCKTEKHPLKVFDSFKRFFKCGNCGNRTCCLEIVPLYSCKNCGSGKWERTTMMKEKIVTGDQLSIRGGEQTFINSNIAGASINLLVPDE